MQRPQSESLEAADGDDGSVHVGDGGVIKRACDQCRTRKVRCDKESPCSNCRIAQRTCSSTGLGQKPREPRQRVLISSQYEKKIDYFGNRLAGIEDALRELTVTIKSHPPSVSSASGTTTASVPYHPPGAVGQQYGSSASNSRTTPLSANAAFDNGDDSDTSSDLGETAFEGQSSLKAHTVQASEFLEHVVERDHWNDQAMSPNMRTALSSLQQMVGLQQQRKKGRSSGDASRNHVKFPNAKPMPPGGFKELPMPPANVVVQMLREIKEQPPVTFTLVCAFIAVEDFTESCRKVYFATEDFNISTFIVVNAGLKYLFQEKFIINNEHTGLAAEYQAYDNMCRDNLETALANLPFFMPPKMETIEALLLATCYSVELSKMSVAWQLNSYAASLCISLGYHRESRQASDDKKPSQPAPPDPLSEKKQALLWFCYMLDKGLALRFGRPSVLQDYDIALPRHVSAADTAFGSVAGPAAAPDPWQEVLVLWIQHAEIQGLTYELLYSHSALQRSVEERVASARMLVGKLTDLHARTVGLRDAIVAEAKRMGQGSVALMTINMVLKGDEVQHHSILALIYRAIPPDDPGRPGWFNEECIMAARNSMATHQECIEMTATSQFMNAAYLHWTIMFVPFVPFIVIFCHVIETGDKEDLRRLEQFVNSLRVSREASGAIDKLHHLSRTMTDVATLYVEAKQNQMPDANMDPIGNDFNMYLSQLGFMPPVQPGFGTAGGDVSAAGGVDSDMLNASYQAAQLGDWFEGGTQMMGLLEEDLSQFQQDASVWSIYGQRQVNSLISKPP